MPTAAVHCKSLRSKQSTNVTDRRHSPRTRNRLRRSFITDRQGIIEYATPGMLDLTLTIRRNYRTDTRIFKSDLNRRRCTTICGKRYSRVSNGPASCGIRGRTARHTRTHDCVSLESARAERCASLRQSRRGFAAGVPAEFDLFAVTEKIERREESVLQTVVNLSSEFQ
jgi:hypothetical protein